MGGNNNAEHEVKQQYNEIESVNTRQFISSNKLNNTKIDEILNHRIDSKITRTSISRSYLDNNIIDQENEQQSKSESKINKYCTYAVNNTSMKTTFQLQIVVMDYRIRANHL